MNSEDRWELLAPSGEDDEGRPPDARVLSSQLARPGVPTHLAAVGDREAKQVRLYVNGVHAGTAPWEHYFATNGPLVVGRNKWNGQLNDHWEGTVDEVRAYSRALGEAEIRGIISGDDVSVGSWRFDRTATDDSGRHLDGTLVGGPGWMPGQATTPNPDDFAVKLDGRDDHVTMPNALETNRSFAISAWVNPVRTDVAGTVVSQDGAPPGKGMVKEQSGFALQSTFDGKWAFAAVTTEGSIRRNIATGGAVQPGVWTHLAGLYDAERQQITLYINGRIVNSVAHKEPAPAPKGLRVGSAQRNDAGVDFFEGGVDDVRVYQRVLFESEIRTIAGHDLTLAHHLKLDDNTSDSSGSRRGELIGGAVFGPGRTGKAVGLNGKDGAVQTGGIDVRTDQSFTVSAWVNLRMTENGEMSAVSLDADQGQGRKFRLGHVKDDRDNQFGTWVFELPETNGRITSVATSALPTEIGDSKWTHLTGTYDAETKTLWLYVNGLRVGDGTLKDPWHSAKNLQLGRAKFGDTDTQHWLGRIDDVRFYTGNLGSDRVWELYKSYGSEVPA
ncbi:LamG domain-containing protein [Crossiella sp. CA198]|uniref:LamG domain-containing protein n=1 Tax=Crossiella sp. CA198 TaxID=3455607 RepID=UPI003F8D0A52